MTGQQRMLAAWGVTACALAALPLLPGCALDQGSPVLPDVSAQVREAERLYREGLACEKRGDADGAIRLYQQAVQTYHDFPAPWNNLGVLLAQKGRNFEAADAYKTAATLDARDPRPMANLGLLWQGLGYLDDAAACYAEAIDRDPSYLPALRESVMVDCERDKMNDVTAARVRKALLLETNATWRAELERRKILIDQRLAASAH